MVFVEKWKNAGGGDVWASEREKKREKYFVSGRVSGRVSPTLSRVEGRSRDFREHTVTALTQGWCISVWARVHDIE